MCTPIRLPAKSDGDRLNVNIAKKGHGETKRNVLPEHSLLLSQTFYRLVRSWRVTELCTDCVICNRYIYFPK